MRAREFISETLKSNKEEDHSNKNTGHSHGVMHDEHESAMTGAHLVRDPEAIDRIYQMNRLGMAMAMADGKSKKPPSSASQSWAGTYNTVHPYTEEEHNMLHQAMGVVPSKHKELVRNHRSSEPHSTHKISPVTAFKGYK